MDSASLFIGDPALRDAVGAALLSAQLEKRGGSSELPPPAYLSVQEVFLALCDAGLKEPFEAVRERLVSSKALKPGSGNSDDNSEPQDSEAVVNVAALLQGIGPREEAGEGTQASFAKPDNLLVVGYGEAMIRLAPMGTGNTDAIYGRGKPSGNAAYLRSIGGDEMNVCVAHTMLGNHAEFLTVLPSGPNGEYVANACVDQGMSTDRIRFVDDADVGVFWVIPTEKRVLYQRKYSAFWINQTEEDFDWGAIFAPAKGLTKWLHATGITPLCGQVAPKVWTAHIEEAVRQGVTVSIDLNHRPALAPFPVLWGIAKAVVGKAHTLILARDSVVNLLIELDGSAGALSMDVPEDDRLWVDALRRIREAVPGPNIVCCFKRANFDAETGKPVLTASGYQEQTRWSVIITPTGEEESTHSQPVVHAPREPCGGGSCWAAGFIDAQVTGLPIAKSMRRADLLASMTQETMGDHSQVTRAMLQAVEARFQGKTAVVRTDEEGNFVV